MTAAAIHWLAPWLLGAQVSAYAAAIDREAVARKLDPLLVVALTWRESRFDAHAHDRRGASWGLMQIRVTKKLHARWWGRERELLDPKTNIRAGVSILVSWRAFHRSHCEHALSGGRICSTNRRQEGLRSRCGGRPSRGFHMRRMPLVRGVRCFWPFAPASRPLTSLGLGSLSIFLGPSHISLGEVPCASRRSLHDTLGSLHCTFQGLARSRCASPLVSSPCVARRALMPILLDTLSSIRRTMVSALPQPLNCGGRAYRPSFSRTFRIGAYRCCDARTAKTQHPFWSHYQHGSRVRSPASGLRVQKTYRALVARYRGGVL